MAERPIDARFALIDSDLMGDPKFVKLARSVDRNRFNAAVGVWLQLLVSARKAKKPTIAWDDWSDDEQAIGDLRAARLLTADGFDPEAFDTWGPKKRYPSDDARGDYAHSTRLRNTTQTTPDSAVSISKVSSSTRDIERDAAESRVDRVVPRSSGNGSEVFMGMKSKKGLHDGSHPDCVVCAPLRSSTQVEKTVDSFDAPADARPLDDVP